MLQSFRGTINRCGIQSLRLERDDDAIRGERPNQAEFWAILSDDELPTIRATIESGDRLLAWRLICERAVWLGGIVC